MELTTLDVTVRVCETDNRGAYAFRCPSCRMAVSKGAEQRVVDLLVSSGVSLETWRLPAELSEQRIGEPLDHDDLLAFHELMESDTWFTQLSSLVEG